MRGAGLAVVLVLLGASPRALASLPSYAEVRASRERSEGALLDRDGRLLHELRVDRRGRRLEWVELGRISRALRDAVVASEDRRFWSHGGVDWLALLKTTAENALGAKPRGASTLSMQLAWMLDSTSGARPAGGRRSVAEKARQIRLARELERSWSKERILEAYLNLVSFRGELQGVEAASRGLFGKAAHGLGLSESLVLAALIRSPEARPALVERRAALLGEVLGHPDAARRIREDFPAGIADVLARPRPIRPRQSLAPFVARKLVTKGERASTLDRDLQKSAIESLRGQLLGLRGRNARDAALLAVDNRTGEVLAYVGGVDGLSSAPYVDGVVAPRQAGSTLKPFLYATALDERYLAPDSRLDDSPADIPVAGGVYRPRNFDNEFRGPDVTLRQALASSLNVPAVRVLGLVGVPSLLARLRKLGFAGLRGEEYYGPSLALGAADVTLWELVGAYRALANGGAFAPLRIERGKASSGVRVFGPHASFLVSDILSDRESRSLTFGLESPLSSRFWTAVKTGTSKDMRDNWCVGYSSRYTVGVWVGNFSGEPMWNVTGISGAAPVWAEVMRRLHRREPSRAPEPPRGLARSAEGGGWRIAGTEPARASPPSDTGVGEDARILYPVEAMVIAPDPDIPSDRQRVFFEAGGRGAAAWALDGQPLPRGVAWKPELPGEHVLELRGADGRKLDAVRFSVSGGWRANAPGQSTD